TIKLADGTTAKGYHLGDFAEAFARFLPATGIPDRNPVTTCGNIEELPALQPSPPPTPLLSETADSANNDGVGYEVPPEGSLHSHWPPDCAAWLRVAQQVLDGDFNDCDRSTRESVMTGLRSLPYPLAQRALERLRANGS